jgi:predicted RNase H-like HicB family nuclease
MPLATIVESYVVAALDRAETHQLETGTVLLTVPDLPGIVASGADVHVAYQELYRMLEEWVLLSLARGYRLPVLSTASGAVDLNTEASRTLATYHESRIASAQGPAGTIYENKDELEAAFDELDRSSQE